jgi:hypothetical protein
MAFLSCPVQTFATDRVVLGHGGGGRLTNQLIESVFLPAFSNSALEPPLFPPIEQLGNFGIQSAKLPIHYFFEGSKFVLEAIKAMN